MENDINQISPTWSDLSRSKEVFFRAEGTKMLLYHPRLRSIHLVSQKIFQIWFDFASIDNFDELLKRMDCDFDTGEKLLVFFRKEQLIV